MGAAEQAADSAAPSASSIASVAAEQAADSSAAADAAADAGSIASVVADPIVQSAAVEPVLPDLPAAVAPSLDLEVVSLVCGQENYGLAIVALGEALWSFLQAPSADHALKTFGPAAVAAVVLVAVSVCMCGVRACAVFVLSCFVLMMCPRPPSYLCLCCSS